MLIEPVEIGSRGRWGKARTLGAIAAPLLLLVALVGAGALSRDAPTGLEADDEPTASADAVADPGPAMTGAPIDRQDPRGSAVIAFPPRLLGLPTQSVEAALQARRAGVSSNELIAIRGYLTVWPAGAGCIDDSPALAGTPGWWCERTAILRDDPSAVLAFEDGAPVWRGVRGGPHLHPTIFPGVSLGTLDPSPRLADAASPETIGDQVVRPTPVLVIGRFDDPRLADRRSSARHVNEGFAIERLAWADGRWRDTRFARFVPWDVADLDLRMARAITAEALPGGTVILSQNVIQPDMLGALSVDAGAAVRAIGDPPGRLWFIRAMTRPSPPIGALEDAGGSHRLGWVVLANDGTILAVDSEG